MKVAVAIPCLDMVPVDFALSLTSMFMSMAYEKKLNKKVPIDLALMHQAGSLIMEARNALVRRAQEVNASHILFLDSDMTFPPDTLSRLASHHKDIVAATYVKRSETERGLLGEHLVGHGLNPTGLIPYRTIPLGCALIKLSVFDRLHTKPYFRYITQENGSISEDTFFSLQCEAANIPIFVDPKLTSEIGHVGMKVYRP